MDEAVGGRGARDWSGLGQKREECWISKLGNGLGAALKACRHGARASERVARRAAWLVMSMTTAAEGEWRKLDKATT